MRQKGRRSPVGDNDVEQSPGNDCLSCLCFATTSHCPLHLLSPFPSSCSSSSHHQETRGKTSISTATSSRKSGRKRKSLDLKLDEMAKQLGNIASAIKSLSTGGIDESELYQQVMTIGADFHEDDLCKAFEFLMTNGVQAKIFNVKSSSLKRKWIESFISSLS